MLQRVYGTAWKSKEQLKAYEQFKAEAARRCLPCAAAARCYIGLPLAVGRECGLYKPGSFSVSARTGRG